MSNSGTTASNASPPRAAAGAPKAPPTSLFARSGKPKEFKKKDVVQLFRGLSSMLRAQINTADALKYYAHGLQNKSMASALMKIRDDIGAGINIHEAFRRSGRFNDMTIGLIQAGSDAGQLHEAIKALALRFTNEMRFNKALKKATVTPAVVISVLVGAFLYAQVKIVPQVEAMLKGVGAKPDGMTAIAFDVSHFTQAVWPYAITGIIAIAVTIALSDKVRNMILNLAMSKWRLLRQMIMSLRQMTFLSTMRLLHSNGINLAKSIRVSANSVKRTPFYRELNEAADKYEKSGVPLPTAFAKYTSVDSQVVHMLSIGEKSASLDNQLDMLCQMYEEDAASYMETFTATVNFLVMIIAVLLIAGVFISAFLPIFLMGPKMMNSQM